MERMGNLRLNSSNGTFFFEYDKVDGYQMYWPGTWPPKDEPKCGFDGLGCPVPKNKMKGELQFSCISYCFYIGSIDVNPTFFIILDIANCKLKRCIKFLQTNNKRVHFKSR